MRARLPAEKHQSTWLCLKVSPVVRHLTRAGARLTCCCMTRGFGRFCVKTPYDPAIWQGCKMADGKH
eukprot:1136688-Pelagomonas_calceolata.AAC.9